MRVLSVVERELRVAARRPATYLNRFGATAAVLGLGVIIYLGNRDSRDAALAATLFTVTAVVAGLLTVLAGLLTADCLSQEKREGTLGLLFLTPLKAYEIVLGKLTAYSLSATYTTLSIVPVLAIPLLMGGIPISAFYRMVLWLLNTLFFSLALGVFVSACSRDARRALGMTFSGLCFFVALCPLLHWLIIPGPGGVGFLSEPFLLLVSPAAGFYFVLEEAFSSPALRGVPASNPASFWISLTLDHLIGWAALLLACVITPRSWQDRRSAEARSEGGWRWSRLKHGTLAQSQALRRHLLDINPLLWFGARDRVKRWLPWVVLGVAFILWWVESLMDRMWLEAPGAIATAILIHTLFKFWIASEACRLMHETRGDGALELLLATPCTVREILQGQRLALFRQFGWPLLAVLVADLFLFYGAVVTNPGTLEDRRQIALCFAAGGSFLLADSWALVWLGLWYGLRCRTYTRAFANTVGAILIVPWGIFAVSMFLYFSLDWEASLQLTFEHGLAWWFLVSTATAVVCGRFAAHNLQSRLRSLASEPNQTRRTAPTSAAPARP